MASAARASSSWRVALVLAGLALAQVVHADDAHEQRPIEEARSAFAQAQSAYAKGDLETARAQLERAHRLAPSAELSYDLARVHERMGDAAKAIALYREYLDHRGASERDRARIARSIAQLEALQKRQSDALRAPPPDVALLDAEARAMFTRGVEAFRAKRYEVALTAFTAARSIAPLPELEYNLARACEELGRSRDAIDHYRAFLHHATPEEAEATRARIAALEARAKQAPSGEGSATSPPPRPKASKRPRPKSAPPPR